MIRLILLSFFVTNFTYAQTIELDNLSQRDLEKIVSEFSANFHHAPVSSAAAMGHIFGFEIGITGGMTDTPELNKIIRNVDPSAEEVDSIPHVALVGRLTVPLGFTGEFTFIPAVDVSDFELDSKSFAIAWDSSLVWSLPVTVGFKYAIANTTFNFTTEVSNVPSQAEYDSTTTGLYVFVSKSFLIVEPYIGLGAVTGDGDLSATASMFNFTAGNSASTDESSTHLILGANVNLLIFKLGLEYGQIFDTSKVTAKIAFGF